MSDETSQELQKILLTALDCLTNEKVNKTTTHRIGKESAKSRWPSVRCVRLWKSSDGFRSRLTKRDTGSARRSITRAVNQPRIFRARLPAKEHVFCNEEVGTGIRAPRALWRAPIQTIRTQSSFGRMTWPCRYASD
jgi:hypothetical protein